jgi:hypothetical protein
MAIKSDKRLQVSPLQIRMREVERAYLEDAARKLSEQSPSKVGVGPFLLWAGKAEAQRQLGVSFADYEARELKRAKGGGR